MCGGWRRTELIRPNKLFGFGPLGCMVKFTWGRTRWQIEAQAVEAAGRAGPGQSDGAELSGTVQKGAGSSAGQRPQKFH